MRQTKENNSDEPRVKIAGSVAVAPVKNGEFKMQEREREHGVEREAMVDKREVEFANCRSTEGKNPV